MSKKEKIDVEVLLDGSIIFSEKELEIPKDNTVAFYFTEVLGYQGLKNLPEEQRHKMLITIVNPFEGMSIVVKGIDGKPEGITLTSGQEYILDQADIDHGDIMVEVFNGDNSLYSSIIGIGTTSSVITLVGDSEELSKITPPTDEMREQIRPDTYDTWVSFMYSSKDYHDIESMILEIAPSNYFANRKRPEEGEFSPEYPEGSIKIELQPNTPSDFILINTLEERDRLWIYKLYDIKDPENPLISMGRDRFTFVFGCTSSLYVKQDEEGFKFRTYKLIPKDSPEYPSYGYYDPYPTFMKSFSFQ